MTTQEAINILAPETTLAALAEIEYYAGFAGEQARRAAVDYACALAVDALALMQKREQGLVVELPATFGDRIVDQYGHEWEIDSIQFYPPARAPYNIIYRLGNSGTDNYSALYTEEFGDVKVVRPEPQAPLEENQDA